MPRLRDRAAIRAILETDRAWSLYALGDLEPGFFEQCEWFAPRDGAPAVALLYRGVKPPVLFALGDLTPLLDEIRYEPALYLHVQPGNVDALSTRYHISHRKEMWRMILDAERYRPVPGAGAVRLAPSDLDEVRRLYADGGSAGEAPDFFFPAMLEQVFDGIREDGELISAAGTHLVAPGESVAAVGNIYTRRDRRGRGLAARATTAVVDELLRLGIRTIGLNVDQRNAAAIRIYERMGFGRRLAFCEGLATAQSL